MSGQGDTHEVGEDAKRWLAWFEQTGNFPEIVQAHKEYEAKNGASQKPAPGATGPENDKAANADATRQVADLGKLADAWHATEAKIHKDMGGLLDHLKRLYGADDAAQQMEQDFQVHFDKITATFDGTLGKELAQAAASRSMDDFQRVKGEMKATVGSFVQTIEADETIALMDANPFVPMAIGKTCKQALQLILAQLG